MDGRPGPCPESLMREGGSVKQYTAESGINNSKSQLVLCNAIIINHLRDTEVVYIYVRVSPVYRAILKVIPNLYFCG